MKKTLYLLLLCASLHANAQTSGDFAGALDKSSFIPSGTSLSSNRMSSARIISNSDGTLAAINLGFLIRGGLTGSVELAGPISKSGVARPASLDGLATDGKATFGIQYKHWKGPSTPEITTALSGTGSATFLGITNVATKNRVLRSLDLGTPWMIGATGTINKKSYEYATDETLVTIENADHTSLIGSAYLTIFIGKRINTLLKFSFTYQRSYTENDPKEYLIPVNNSSILVKGSFIVGAPQKSDLSLPKIELATRFHERWGINPSVTYRSGSSDVVFDLPIYFIPEQQNGQLLDVNGGIFLNCTTSADKPFVVGIFVGTSLSKLL